MVIFHSYVSHYQRVMENMMIIHCADMGNMDTLSWLDKLISVFFSVISPGNERSAVQSIYTKNFKVVLLSKPGRHCHSLLLVPKHKNTFLGSIDSIVMFHHVPLFISDKSNFLDLLMKEPPQKNNTH